jgi:hypothetical protein
LRTVHGARQVDGKFLADAIDAKPSCRPGKEGIKRVDTGTVRPHRPPGLLGPRLFHWQPWILSDCGVGERDEHGLRSQDACSGDSIVKRRAKGIARPLVPASLGGGRRSKLGFARNGVHGPQLRAGSEDTHV